MGTEMSDVRIGELWERKIKKLSKRIQILAMGDDDLYQEGILGLRKALLSNPNGKDSYLVSIARFAMLHYMDRGRSVDNGAIRPQKAKLKSGEIRTYQKDMLPVYLDDPKEQLELSAYTFPPDLLAIDRMCSDLFYSSLNDEEADFIQTCKQLYLTNGIFRNLHAMDMLKISEHKFNRIKRDVKKKFIRTFGTDEQVAKLERVGDIRPTALTI